METLTDSKMMSSAESDVEVLAGAGLSFADEAGVDVRAATRFVILGNKPADVNPDRTILVRINDPSPRAMVGQVLFVNALLTPTEILHRFNDDMAGWIDMPNHAYPDTELCLSASVQGTNQAALVVFQLRANYNDTFVHHSGRTTYAVLGGDSGAYDALYQPEWIGTDYKTVSVYVAAPTVSTKYILGINLAGTAVKPTPLFVDPKIENNG